MESTITSNTDWKEIAITAGVVVVFSFCASLGALYAYDAFKKAAAKRAEKKEKEPAKK